MPAKSPQITTPQQKALRELGQKLRDYRKMMGISSIATAEAAGLSRVTLYRIEQGEASVAMGAYLSVIFALGLTLELTRQDKNIKKDPEKKLPKAVRIANYPQLKKLSWQIKKTKELSPKDALDLYERNWKYIDVKSMSEKERQLLKILLTAFGRERLLV